VILHQRKATKKLGSANKKFPHRNPGRQKEVKVMMRVDHLK
jgi:hypothetical protein